MPRFNVQWKWSTEWIIEAASADALNEAATEYQTSVLKDLQSSDAMITVFGQTPSSRDQNLEAVLVNGELLHPEDKEAKEEWDRLIIVAEDQEVAKFEAQTGNLFD